MATLFRFSRETPRPVHKTFDIFAYGDNHKSFLLPSSARQLTIDSISNMRGRFQLGFILTAHFAWGANVDPTCLSIESLDTSPLCADLFRSSLAAVRQLNARSRSLLQQELVRVVSATQEPAGSAPGDFRFEIDLLVGSSRACQNVGPPFGARYEYVAGGRRVRCPVDKSTLRTVNVDVLAHGRPPVRQFSMVHAQRTDAEQVIEGLRAEREAEAQEANAIVGGGVGGAAGGAAAAAAAAGVGLPDSPAGGVHTGVPPLRVDDGGTLVGGGPSALGRLWHRHTAVVVAVLVLLCCCCAPKRRQRTYAPVVSEDFDMEAYRARMAQKYNLEETTSQPQRFSV